METSHGATLCTGSLWSPWRPKEKEGRKLIDLALIEEEKQPTLSSSSFDTSSSKSTRTSQLWKMPEFQLSPVVMVFGYEPNEGPQHGGWDHTLKLSSAPWMESGVQPSLWPERSQLSWFWHLPVEALTSWSKCYESYGWMDRCYRWRLRSNCLSSLLFFIMPPPISQLRRNQSIKIQSLSSAITNQIYDGRSKHQLDACFSSDKDKGGWGRRGENREVAPKDW